MALSEKTLLYVEDDTLTLTLMEKMVHSSFKEIHLARSGDEGLELFKEKQPDIVVSDYQMPGINGEKLLQKIKEIDPGALFIFLTAYPEDIEEISAKADAVIAKPVVKKEFLEIVSKLCDI